tara:strand:+ start:340 stop:546 length:207 start_codon:yes stop_codon:yes gene_type:complete
MAEAGFWDNQEKARETIAASNRLKSWTQPWKKLKLRLVELQELKELIELDEDQELEDEWTRELQDLDS